MMLRRFNSYCLIKLLYSTLHDQSCDTLGRNQPAGLMADINLSRRRDIRAIDIFIYYSQAQHLFTRQPSRAHCKLILHV